MRFSRKQVLFIVIGIVILLNVWYVSVKLKDHKSFLFQLRELAFPTKYSQGQVQNFQVDLSSAAKQWKHHDLGKKYFEAGEYDKSIAEYKTAIEMAKQDPRDWVQINDQKFPRGRLWEVYEKAGSFQEAIEQIDWLLAHKPSEPHRLDLLAWKKVITAESAGQYEKAIMAIDEFLKSSEELNEYRRTKDKNGWVQPEFVLEEFRVKREEIQQKLVTGNPELNEKHF